MNKNKKRLLSIIFVFAFFAMTIFSLSKFLPNNKKIAADANSAATVTYKDWSELSSIDNNYSYSTLFYSKDTEFYVNTNQEEGISIIKHYTVDDNPVPCVDLKENGRAQVIITNCGIDKEGNMMDVTFDVNVANTWGGSGNEGIRFCVNRISFNADENRNISSQDNLNFLLPNLYRPAIDYNQPFQFNLDTSRATAEVALTYYIHDDNNVIVDDTKYYSTCRDCSDDELQDDPSYRIYHGTMSETSEIDTSITKVNSFYDDIDTSRNYDSNGIDYGIDLFEGKEGIAPLNGTSTIYYKKSDEGKSTFNVNGSVVKKVYAQIKEKDNGIYIYEGGKYDANDNLVNDDEEVNIQGLMYYNSTEFLTENLNGVFNFTYSGWGCGIGFIFFSPQSYTFASPTKRVTKTNVLTDESFVYAITQYIPNNYFSNVVDFSTVYSNIKNGRLSSFSINDYQMDEDLKINNYSLKDINGDLDGLSTITMTTEPGTNHVSVNVDDINLFDNPKFYNNSIRLLIKVYSNEIYSNQKTLSNKAYTVITTQNSSEPITNNSNNINVQISSPKVIYDCLNNEENHRNKYYSPNSNVDLSLTCEKDGREFLGWSTNQTDFLNTLTIEREDITVYALYKPIIEVGTVNQTKVYDGEALVASNMENDCYLKSGTLESGHRVVCSYFGSQLNVGNSTKTITPSVLDSNDIDVTDYYDIRTTNGTLTVTPKSITITTPNQEKVYDSTPLNATNDCASTDLVGNDTISCVSSGQITNVGTTTKEIQTVKINNQNIENSNYIIGIIINGTLKITPKPITISTTDQQKVYSELELVVNNDCTAEGLLNNETITCKNYGLLENNKVYQIKDVMTIPKKIDSELVKINNQSIENSNYIIESVEDATLKITPITIKVKATDQSKSYDRLPLNADETCELIDNTSILTNQKLKCTSSGSQTNVGSSEKTLQTVKILDENNVDISSNYIVVKNDGVLIVTPVINPITLENNGAIIPGTPQIYEICDDVISLDVSKSNVMTTTANAIDLPEKIGYTFDGYYSTNDEDGILLIDKNGYITENLTANVCNGRTIYAKWIPNKYKLTVIYNNGKDNDVYTLEYNETKDILNPEKQWYTFKEWILTGPSSKFENKVFTMGHEDATLEATYEKDPAACETILQSDVYNIEHTTRTINIEQNVTVEEIRKNITSKGVIGEVTDKQIIVRCGEDEIIYKISRYFAPHTGNVLTKSFKIFGFIGIVLVLLFIIRKQVFRNAELKQKFK